MDDKKKKDRSFLCVQCITAAVGLVLICLNGNFMLLIPYLICMGASIPTMYFNYSLCKSENRWFSFWRMRNPVDGEPSEFRLIAAKISEWVIFMIGLIIALLPSIV